jgi:hypothetical protein
MSEPERVPESRRFEFEPTSAVRQSRSSDPFVPCPGCRADNERYLFHEDGRRFVQCRVCGVVYVNPPAREVSSDFTLAGPAGEPSVSARDELQSALQHVVATSEQRMGRPPRRIVVAGRGTDLPLRHPPDVTLDVIAFSPDDASRLVREADIGPIEAALVPPPDVLILNQLLEACPRASEVVAKLAGVLPDKTAVAVVFDNTGSLPGRFVRRHWRRIFEWKSVNFDSENLRGLMERNGLRALEQAGLRTQRVIPGLRRVVMQVPEGRYVAMYARSTATADDTLSIIVPAYNEARYIGAVLDALLNARFVVPHEILVIESNSTDGTREIVRQYEGVPGVTVVLEDQPRGKGAAVRHGIAASSGSIILIQDADFEYDLDDYDALLEPIKQHRTSFVLGSRSLGIDDWKVRKMASSRVKAFLMNGAQLLFAKTFNLLYQQRVTDVNTMFKVFRRECLDDLPFTADGFSFDIELACMLIRAGYSPMEVPVNYVARGFDEGKKIRFLIEFFPSYSMFFRRRFSRWHRQ